MRGRLKRPRCSKRNAASRPGRLHWHGRNRLGLEGRSMTRITTIAFAASFVAIGLTATPAAAQNRVFVAAQGADGNPCTFALPCRTFQHAHDTVAAGGEIDVLDPAGYGSVTISKSISIQGHGFAGIAVASGNGITINAPGSDINLRGLLIDGIGSGTIGIDILSGASVTVEEGLVRGFTATGLVSSSASITLAVSDSYLANNGTHGISFQPTGSDPVFATFNRVETYNNGSHGIVVNGSSNTATINVTIYNSVAARNGATGFLAQSL